ncbi:MAG: hypothetical protein EPN43_01915 [Jatrophihabitans sp.]|nr:MAG: hypothetical protein EPN43_01915 [Jatrophihabitans sp.]
MTGRLTAEEIARVRTQHGIVDVLARCGVVDGIGPGRMGDFMICCPSPRHEDRSPSCAVHPFTGRFYCFGCGAHGDVFGLITELTGIRSLAHIAELLDAGGSITTASRAPVMSRTIHRIQNAGGPEFDRTPAARVLECNAAAWAFLVDGRRGDRARLYLARRGIDLWPLEGEAGRPLAGHTPAERAGLTCHLLARGFTGPEIVDAGWTITGSDGTVDRFRGRVLFPVRDDADRVLGAIGRDVTGTSRCRYLNTAHTVVYSKGATLYTPLRFRDVTVVVCEGPVDAVAIAAAAASGAKAGPLLIAVTPSGTALTQAQAQLVAGMTTQPPVVCGDGDAAGRAAARLWAFRLAHAGSSPRVMTLPDGYDPASWLQERGAAGLTAFAAPGLTLDRRAQAALTV